MCNGGRNETDNEWRKETLTTLISYKDQHTPMSWEAIYSLIQDCTPDRSIEFIRKVHVLLAYHGLSTISYICDHLIRFFAACEILLEAHQVFCRISQPTVYTWHAIISAHTKAGEGERGLELYLRMQQEGVKPNKFVFLCVLKICANEKGAKEGRSIHDGIVRSGHESDMLIQNTLVDVYSKCGSLGEAYSIFGKLKERSIVSYGAMIAGYAAHGAGSEALKLFRDMLEAGLIPNSVIFLSAFKACGSINALEEGRLLHRKIIMDGITCDEIVSSSIIDMYLKCGILDDADNIFSCLSRKDVISWSAMILGYADQGYGRLALSLYADMQAKGVKPSNLTFLGVVKGCWIAGTLGEGRCSHATIVMENFEFDLVVANALIDMYAKCGSLADARHVFDRLPSKDAVSYNSMIQGYVEQELGLPALVLYSSMRGSCIQPSKVTFPTILKACSIIKALAEGHEIHADVVTRDFDSDLMIQTSLVDLYAKCGNMREACKVFEAMEEWDVASWGSISGGYAQSGDWELARYYFLKMQRYNLRPDAWIFSTILAACSHAGEVDQGRLEEARDMFQSIPKQLDDHGWTALLTSCRIGPHIE